MAYFSFTNKLINGETIRLFNNGDMKRDFDFTPSTSIEEGLSRFAKWYKAFYQTDR